MPNKKSKTAKNKVTVRSSNPPRPKVGKVQAPTIIGNRLQQSKFSVRSGKMDGSILINGSDYVGTIGSTGSNFGAGVTLRNDFLSPGGSIFSGSRLEMFARMYEKYLFNWFKVKFYPTQGTGVGAALIIAFDKDFADSTPDPSELGVRTYLSWQCVTTGPTWAPMELHVKNTDTQNFYYTNDTGREGRMSYQGQIYFALAAADSAVRNYGYYTIEYELLLMDPQLESPMPYTAFGGQITTPNTQSGRGWNQALNGPVSGPAKMVQNPSDPSSFGLMVPPGTYVLEQLMTAASNTGNAFGTPTLIPNLPGALGSISTIFNPVGPSPTNNSTITKVVVPQGGGLLLGNVLNTNPISGSIIRLLESSLSAVY